MQPAIIHQNYLEPRVRLASYPFLYIFQEINMVAPTSPDSIAWVTGASTGIGAAVVKRLVDKGWRVAVTARSEDKLQDLAREHGEDKIIVAAGDVTNRDAMQTIVSRLEADGILSLVLLNAGIYEPVDGTEPDTDLYLKTFSVNMNGTIHCMMPVIEAMKRQGGGHIAVVASVAGYSGLPTSSAYGATKAGLINLCEALKFDLDRLGIKIQVINPGFVDTPATEDNPFPMPFMVSSDVAAERIVEGLAKNSFEITFPKRFTYILKFLRILPYSLYFPLVARGTGWSKKG
jgi:short-subunit dehydrogenase